MTQSAVCKGNVKWNISVPSEFDEEIRFFLASQGGIKEDLSALVIKAVSRYILASLSGEAKDKVKNSSLSQKDLDKIIVDGLAWAKNRRNEEPS